MIKDFINPGVQKLQGLHPCCRRDLVLYGIDRPHPRPPPLLSLSPLQILPINVVVARARLLLHFFSMDGGAIRRAIKICGNLSDLVAVRYPADSKVAKCGRLFHRFDSFRMWGCFK